MSLRPYQIEAIRKLRSLYAAGETRATLVMPCGTGKTIVAAVMIPTSSGAVTVFFVPTLGLLAQTWVNISKNVPGVTLFGVCSKPPRATRRRAERAKNGSAGLDADAETLTEDITLEAAEALVGAKLWATPTPDDVIAAMRHTNGPLVILATYASAAVVTSAAEKAGTEFDLIICDEAHRTVGSRDKYWSTPVHTTPARRRLFMTATPVIISIPENLKGAVLKCETVSMGSTADYGKQVEPLTLRQAIDEGWLAPYHITVVGVSERSAYSRLLKSSSSKGHSPTAAATQIALLESADKHGLQSVMVFHNSVKHSKEWVHTLEQVARLRGTPLDVIHMDADTSAKTRELWCGKLGSPERLTVVSNCRLLSEGIDVPALDGVMLADPRNSSPDIVQILGRPLRIDPLKPNKVAHMILPVLDFEDDSSDIDAKVARTRYWATWQILLAIGEVDELLHLSLARLDQYHTSGATGVTAPELISIDAAALGDSAYAFLLKDIKRVSDTHLVTALRLLSYQRRHGTTLIKGDRDSYMDLAKKMKSVNVAYAAGRVDTRAAEVFESIPGFAWTAKKPARIVLTDDEKIELLGRRIRESGFRLIRRNDPKATSSRGGSVDFYTWLSKLDLSRLSPDQLAALNATGYRLAS